MLIDRDLINRQKAIDVLCGITAYKNFIPLDSAIFNIKKLPSAECKGKWVNHRNDDGHNIADCNLCGSTLQWFDNDGEHNYCPNCGARMEGEEE